MCIYVSNFIERNVALVRLWRVDAFITFFQLLPAPLRPPQFENGLHPSLNSPSISFGSFIPFPCLPTTLRHTAARQLLVHLMRTTLISEEKRRCRTTLLHSLSCMSSRSSNNFSPPILRNTCVVR
ncbi:hypothetical protein, unlikely [Trypanosoma brucei gambiense DAL972]|uniref:Uncharacterized protein n=1 Tax=Trypanosoma brucei gambiense (strain MHOM/CI/86/DAL972) TaxID=679716 RepID=C9ZNM1_TRYB9|nr:hypothetical protein, unlikely [Trypanosoma brucei gambiense DAL972]CBH10999.1 hypothetical protein, unlikely [Trypanosoma brucei gambiense DAL972]|eukprot:XP_011773286.1 hypothetical protein, unlikely [Trypanosoma brucei gambiense DAL972]